MPSSFNLKEQENNISSKIVVALERISEAFRVMLWNESRNTGLSPIQLQIIIFLLYHTSEKCKVGYIADEFNMTKATISDSVKALLQKGAVEKEADEDDTRSFSIRLSKEGKKMAQQAALFAGKLEKPISALSKAQQEVLLNSLLHTIHDLNRAGIITVQRMCFTCHYYKGNAGKHYCELLQKKLRDTDLRIDCAEYEAGG